MSEASLLDTVYSDYLSRGFDQTWIDQALKAFGAARRAKVFGPFDTVAVTGLSGLLMGPVLAREEKLNLLVVRRGARGTNGPHSSYPIEGRFGTKGYIVVDDFISSGATIGRIAERVKEKSPLALRGCFCWATKYKQAACISAGYVDSVQWKGLPIVTLSVGGRKPYRVERYKP